MPTAKQDNRSGTFTSHRNFLARHRSHACDVRTKTCPAALITFDFGLPEGQAVCLPERSTDDLHTILRRYPPEALQFERKKNFYGRCLRDSVMCRDDTVRTQNSSTCIQFRSCPEIWRKRGASRRALRAFSGGGAQKRILAFSHNAPGNAILILRSVSVSCMWGCANSPISTAPSHLGSCQTAPLAPLPLLCPSFARHEANRRCRPIRLGDA